VGGGKGPYSHYNHYSLSLLAIIIIGYYHHHFLYLLNVVPVFDPVVIVQKLSARCVTNPTCINKRKRIELFLSLFWGALPMFLSRACLGKTISFFGLRSMTYNGIAMQKRSTICVSRTAPALRDL
jgi:hypothetical protein